MKTPGFIWLIPGAVINYWRVNVTGTGPFGVSDDIVKCNQPSVVVATSELPFAVSVALFPFTT